MPMHRGARAWKAVLFDLDGTPLDTRPGMRAALEAATEEVTGATNGAGAESANLSLPLDAMVRSAIPTTSPAVASRVADAFRRHYDAGHWATAEVYPQAKELLRQLNAAGVRVFVVTNKRGSSANRLLERFELARYVEEVVGQSDTEAPIPKATLAGGLLKRAGLDPEETVVVGDSDQDAVMAHAGRMTFCAFTSGAGPLSQATADQKRVEMGRLMDVARFVLAGDLRREP